MKLLCLLLCNGLGLMICKKDIIVPIHWRIQGGAAARAPQQDQFLSFSHMFSLKSVCIGGWRPPPQWVGTPPMGNPGSATDYPFVN